MYLVRYALALFLIAAAVTNSGCAAHKKIPLPTGQYQSSMKEDRFVPVNVELEQYVDGQLVSTSNSGLAVNLFRKSGLFADVSATSPYIPYNIRLKFNKQFEDGELYRTCKAIISAGTLFVIPVTLNLKYDLLAEIRIANEPLGRYNYSIKNDNFLWIGSAHDVYGIDFNSLEMLLDHLFQDLIATRTLPSSPVRKELNGEKKQNI